MCWTAPPGRCPRPLRCGAIQPDESSSTRVVVNAVDDVAFRGC